MSSKKPRVSGHRPKNIYGVKVFLSFVHCSLLVNILQNVYNHHEDIIDIIEKEPNIIKRTDIKGTGTRDTQIYYLEPINNNSDLTNNLLSAIYRYRELRRKKSKQEFSIHDDDLLKQKWTKEFIKKWYNFFENDLNKNTQADIRKSEEYRKATKSV